MQSIRCFVAVDFILFEINKQKAKESRRQEQEQEHSWIMSHEQAKPHEYITFEKYFQLLQKHDRDLKQFQLCRQKMINGNNVYSLQQNKQE